MVETDPVVERARAQLLEHIGPGDCALNPCGCDRCDFAEWIITNAPIVEAAKAQERAAYARRDASVDVHGQDGDTRMRYLAEFTEAHRSAYRATEAAVRAASSERAP